MLTFLNSTNVRILLLSSLNVFDFKEFFLYPWRSKTKILHFCEIDFDVLDDRFMSKLFVVMTRAQLRLDVITTEKAASCLIAVI